MDLNRQRIVLWGVAPCLLLLGGALACSKPENAPPTANSIAPQITVEPTSQAHFAGQTVRFTAAATGAPAPSLQWERSADGTTWSPIIGATSSNYSFTAAVGDSAAQFHLKASNSAGSTLSQTAVLTVLDIPTSDFGPNVLVMDPSMPSSALQELCSSVFSELENSQFGSVRKALLFKPGNYNLDVRVGFYTQVLGLGASPDDVAITGAVRSTAYLMSDTNHNATCNFWRGCENLALTPSASFGGTNMWAVAQATPFRRMHIKGNLALHDNNGWASGGTILDSKIDGNVDSGTQQQWISRNSQWGSWTGSNWNMVFVGVTNPPTGNWPDPPYTVVNQVPVIREKPFLTVSGTGAYQVFVPALRSNSSGTTWTGGAAAGENIPITQFHIARPETDTAASINAALASGKHLLVTPGIYHLSEPIRVTQPNTVVLGLGFATLVPDGGVMALSVADVDGVKIAGLLIDAGTVNSPVLMEVGPSGSSADHSANPTSLHDVFFRVGGAGVGKADVSLRINSHKVIGDHFWIWRADHGVGGGSVGWNANTTTNGLIVNGNDVTIYGLFVEHYHRHQTLWNGERGKVYFYQSELPYDIPDQASWMSGAINGFASYKVADAVTTHEAWGLGIYSLFRDNESVKLASAIEAPAVPGVKFHHMVSVSLRRIGEITHVINNTGNAVNSGNMVTKLAEFP